MSGGGRVVALVPAWRAAAFIGATLDALAAQTWREFEVLISDDASSDGTAALCEARAAQDGRFRVMRQPRNLGWIGNSNALLAAARGEYLMFAFQDDLPAPTYVERCVEALEREPAAVLAFSDIELVQADGRRESKDYPLLDGRRGRLERARIVARREGSWWIPNRGVFRGWAAGVIGGLRRNGAGEFSADWPWLLHMSLLGGFVRVPERLCVKIYQPRSLSRTWSGGARAWCAVTGSALQVGARAGLPLRERSALAATLVGSALPEIRRATRRRLSGVGRRLGFGRRAG